jgi:hypothetical protein
MPGRIRTKLAAVGLAVAASAALAVAATPANPAAAATPAAVPSPTTTTIPYCRVSFPVVAQWPTAYVLNIVITNISSVPVRWRLVIRFYGPVLGASVWNASYTQAGSVATVVPYPPSDVMPPGVSVTIGQLILSGGTIVLPTGEVTCTPV